MIVARYSKDGYRAEHKDGPFVAFEDYARLQARVAELEAILLRGIQLHENTDAATCMCGDRISAHQWPTDHKPISSLEYYSDIWTAEAEEALGGK